MLKVTTTKIITAGPKKDVEEEKRAVQKKKAKMNIKEVSRLQKKKKRSRGEEGGGGGGQGDTHAHQRQQKKGATANSCYCMWASCENWDSSSTMLKAIRAAKAAADWCMLHPSKHRPQNTLSTQPPPSSNHSSALILLASCLVFSSSSPPPHFRSLLSLALPLSFSLSLPLSSITKRAREQSEEPERQHSRINSIPILCVTLAISCHGRVMVVNNNTGAFI